ncbi:oligosaccharide flippase family protein [Methanobacterium ferruginis]|uniref:oligosaccharide flippase family protein n=1 Tax=Methanobacterium ferruginis TaxID=710191 RepID=UPI00257462F2|nr:oligosaccharide flippase family protein [Methanobacterium ferruginis]BDZ68997.1 polysaccharide biosynthesis protein [Methanobacterium ferruginis]
MNKYTLFTRQVGLVGIIYILTSLSTFILLPILTNNLTIQEYGVWVQVNVTVLLISNLSQLGMPNTMTRFLAAENEREEIQEGLYSILSLVLVVAITVSAVLFLLSDQLGNLLFNGNEMVAKILPFIILTTGINNFLLTYFRTFQQMKKYSSFILLQSYLNVLSISFLVLSGLEIFGAIMGLLITQIIVFFIMFIFIVSDIGFKTPNFRNIREYLTFGLPTVPSTLSSWIVDSSDRYIIGLLLGTTFVGYYSPSYTLATIISMLLIPFSTMLPPVLTKHYDENRNDQVKTIMFYSLKYYLILAIPAVFGLSLLSRPILMILTTPEIALNGYLVTPFVTLGALLYGIYGIYGVVLLLKMKTKIIGSVWIIAALFNIIFNIILVPIFGILAAAVVTLFTYLITFMIVYLYSNKFFKFHFDYKILVKILISSSLMAILIVSANPNGIISVFTIIIISILIYTAIIFLLGVIEKDELKFFIQSIRT